MALINILSLLGYWHGRLNVTQTLNLRRILYAVFGQDFGRLVLPWQARRYAFALPEEHELYDAFNQKILQETDESDWRDLIDRYIPERKKKQ